MPMKNPPHPGDLIRTEVVEALGLTVSKAAEILQVRRAPLSDLLHGKAAGCPMSRVLRETWDSTERYLCGFFIPFAPCPQYKSLDMYGITVHTEKSRVKVFLSSAALYARGATAAGAR
jgi:hypothetical protein